MINIRRGVFETNSSSMHSVAIMKKKEGTYSKEEITSSFDNHILSFEEGDLEFERAPFRILTTFKEKMAYLIAETCGYAKEEDISTFMQQVTEICKEYDPEFQKIQVPILEEEVCVDKDGNLLSTWFVYDKDLKKNVYNKDGEEHIVEYTKTIHPLYYGNVDHQSKGCLTEFLKTNKLSYKDYLINKKYIVIIDGDEYCYFDALARSGVVNKDDFSGKDKDWIYA